MESGQLISNNLRLVRLLGRGGMGSVWVADHLALGAQVAVKFMWRVFAENPQFVERFRREAAAAAQIKSPHVAQVFDHGISLDGEPFIVMELLEGEELSKRIKREVSLSPALVAEVLSQTAKALGRAHSLGIVHRDLKPDNLFLLDLEGDVFVKVLDFGIAKMTGDGNMSMTSTGGVIGTPLYMSPEQLLSAKHVDFRSDLWSLGVVAYHALTGRVPFCGDTVGAVSVAVHAGKFTPPSALVPSLPTSIDVWFERVFRRDPAQRFESAREMSDAFRLAACASGSYDDARARVRASAPDLGAGPREASAVPLTPSGTLALEPPRFAARPAGPLPGAGTPPLASERQPPAVEPKSPASPSTLSASAVTNAPGVKGNRTVFAVVMAGLALSGLVAGVLLLLRPWGEGGERTSVTAVGGASVAAPTGVPLGSSGSDPGGQAAPRSADHAESGPVPVPPVTASASAQPGADGEVPAPQVPPSSSAKSGPAGLRPPAGKTGKPAKPKSDDEIGF